MTAYRQAPPFAVQMEATEGCNLSCSFCSLNSIRPSAGGPFYFMEVDTAEFIAKEMARLGWKSRVEFAMHGEPTMHRDLEGLIRVMRRHLPQNSFMLTTNGGGLLGRVDRIPALFDAGLNVLALDDYDGVNIVPRLLREINEERLGEWGATLYHYPAEAGGNPHPSMRRRPSPRRRIISVVEDLLTASRGTHSTWTNQAGQAGPRSGKRATARCAKPFRELSFRYNGKVSVCCNDFRGVFKIGDVQELGLDALWQHPRFAAARKKLYHGQRDFGPCLGCDARSYRVGLLPDPTGQKDLPRASRADKALLREAMDGPPMGKIQVKRPWDDLSGMETEGVTLHEKARVDQ